MRKLAFLFVAFALVAVSLYGCDETTLAEPGTNDMEATAPRFAVTTNDRTFMEWWSPYVECSDTPERVHVSGYVHYIEALTEDAAGGTHIMVHHQQTGWRAVGEITGDVYRLAGVIQWSTHSAPALPYEETYVNNWRWIGPRGIILATHLTWHMTVNANGVVTTEVINGTAGCR